ncbi:MAG: hypothetical protein JW850_17830 [Thermoflexales bacterium]|nr:hypothetical protein [Thermoflexales bacterium]
MYLTDNLGRRYDHIITNGAAKMGGDVYSNKPPAMLDGVFVFPPALPGGTVFTFHDDDQHIAISINLGARP